MGRIVNRGATSAGRTRFLQLSTPIVGTLLAAPLLGLLLTDPGRSTAPADLGFRGGEAFVSTLAWSIGVAVIAWGLGARAITRGRIGGGVALLSLVGLLVPASLWFDAWWLEVGPSSWIGRSAAEGQWVAGLRRIVLLLGLLGVTVPLTIWIRMGRGGPPTIRFVSRIDRAVCAAGPNRFEKDGEASSASSPSSPSSSPV